MHTVLEQIVALVNNVAKDNGLELDVERNNAAGDQITIESIRWCDEAVTVTLSDPESVDLELTMLDKNRCIAGTMRTSNLPHHVVVAAIVDHLALTI